MLNRLNRLQAEYPRQFWLLFWGMLISTVGSSMIWPFLMIYVSKKLGLPLMTGASLMTLNSVMGLVFSFMAGPIIDKVGRKWIMVVSLIMNGLAYLLMGQAFSLLHFAILMSITGAFNPLYRIGADAMMADLVPAEKRIDAYSLLRTSNNIGVALGPAIGGFIAAISYTYSFSMAALGLVTYGLLITFFANETLPQRDPRQKPEQERFGGYDRIFRDIPFMHLILAFTLTMVSASMLWVLLGVYAYKNYGVTESLYGWIPTTNALMVVFLQLLVTRYTRQRPAWLVLALGAALYALGVGSVGLGTSFWAFWVSIIIFTLGELVVSPTATTLAANLAPADMRGRYMSLYGLTWGAAAGIGPVVGGWLNDHISPQAIWYGGFLIGLVSAVYFLRLARRSAMQQSEL